MKIVANALAVMPCREPPDWVFWVVMTGVVVSPAWLAGGRMVRVSLPVS